MRRIGIIFGGRSGEHEVSLMSAASVISAVDRKKFEIVTIGITREGNCRFHVSGASRPLRRRRNYSGTF